MSTPAANFAMTPPMALVVAANSAEYEQIAQCLQPFYRTLKATGLGEATTHLQRLQPAVVVLDPDLPDGNGIEWLRYLRSNPATRDLVVACVTHRSTVRDKISGFIAGADDYVIYPINLETFGYRVTLLARIGRHSPWKR
jgi:two-component system OmpR family response regulator